MLRHPITGTTLLQRELIRDKYPGQPLDQGLVSFGETARPAKDVFGVIVDFVRDIAPWIGEVGEVSEEHGSAIDVGCDFRVDQVPEQEDVRALVVDSILPGSEGEIVLGYVPWGGQWHVPAVFVTH